MMTTNRRRLGLTAALAALIAVLALSTVALAQGPGTSEKLGPEMSAGELSQQEIEGLLYMREEEKLARDVYMTLAEAWGLQIFQNIAGSEQQHMDAIERLLLRYDLGDPVAGSDIGEFTNATLQELYGELVETGSGSLADALKVGATIEEIDILDLEEHIAQTNRTDILRVYNSLLSGSGNHFRAFVSTLARETNETYEPRHLSQEAYDTIVSSTMVTGNGRSPRGRGGSRGGLGWSKNRGSTTWRSF